MRLCVCVFVWLYVCSRCVCVLVWLYACFVLNVCLCVCSCGCMCVLFLVTKFLVAVEVLLKVHNLNESDTISLSNGTNRLASNRRDRRERRRVKAGDEEWRRETKSEGERRRVKARDEE